MSARPIARDPLVDAPLDLGAVTVQRVVELDRWAFPAQGLFPDMPAELVEEGRAWLGERCVDPVSGELILNVHTYVLRVGGRTILLDTCNGNHKERPALAPHHMLDTPYLANLERAGVRPEDVDLVLCTHLHPDHVGWNTRLRDGRWVPTFPNAKYLMAREELAFFERLHAQRPEDPLPADLVRTYADSVLPVIAAEQAVVVEHDAAIERELDHGIRLEPAPGHTLGHVVVHVEGTRSRALASGDVIHHPLQLRALDLANAGDADPALAAATRRRVVEGLADSETILLPGHFPAPTGGRVVSRGDALDFAWLER